MLKVVASAGQIWRDDCYYLDLKTGECKRKYVLMLAVESNTCDAITAVLTSRPNGLTEAPPCSLGPPRAGYYVGVPGGAMPKPTWVDFSSIETLDNYDLAAHVSNSRKSLIAQTLPPEILCAVLRCVLQSEDITMRQARWIGDAVAALNCA